jgi:hypothetical protein
MSSSKETLTERHNASRVWEEKVPTTNLRSFRPIQAHASDTGQNFAMSFRDKTKLMVCQLVGGHNGNWSFDQGKMVVDKLGTLGISHSSGRPEMTQYRLSQTPDVARLFSARKQGI